VDAERKRAAPGAAQGALRRIKISDPYATRFLATYAAKAPDAAAPAKSAAKAAKAKQPAPQTVVDAVQLFNRRDWNSYGLKPLDVGGKGDCQFLALQHELEHVLKLIISVQGLRQVVADHLKDQEHMAQFVCVEVGAEFAPAWAKFCNDLRRMGTWGDNHTLVAVANIFKVDIRVFSYDPQHDRVIPYIEGSKTTVQLCVGHYPENHYVAMTPRRQ
jgi:hypothetical protein